MLLCVFLVAQALFSATNSTIDEGQTLDPISRILAKPEIEVIDDPKEAERYKPDIVVASFKGFSKEDAIALIRCRLGVSFSKVTSKYAASIKNPLNGYLWVDSCKCPVKFNNMRYRLMGPYGKKFVTLLLPKDAFLEEEEFRTLARRFLLIGEDVLGFQAVTREDDEGAWLLGEGGDKCCPGLLVVKRKQIDLYDWRRCGDFQKRFILRSGDDLYSVLVLQKTNALDTAKEVDA